MKHLLALLTLAALCLRAPAEPVISEFMADNRSTLLDEDGEFPDWIEIHNPTSAPIDLTGWKLTDDAENPGKWTFPQLTLQPGEFRVFFASEKSALRPDHVNFKLAADGEYLALVRPDGTTAQQFAPSYPRQAGDESFGMRFATTPLVQAGAATRYRVPSGPLIGWQDPSYNQSAWSQGPSGLGFGITEPGITARQVFKNGTISSLADANALLALPAGSTGIRAETTKVVSNVNFLGDGSDGRFGFNASPPGGSGEHYAIEATGFVHITTAGYYTFGLNSDDGGSITINSTDVMVDDSFHGPEDRTGIIYLNVGAHPFRVVMFQGAGGNGLEFYAAPGVRSGWIDGVYQLVGDTANGGLAATTAPTGSSNVTATNLQSAMGTRTSAFFRQVFSANGPGTATSLALVMRYNDGFEAWLNGTRVAAANTELPPPLGTPPPPPHAPPRKPSNAKRSTSPRSCPTSPAAPTCSPSKACAAPPATPHSSCFRN